MSRKLIISLGVLGLIVAMSIGLVVSRLGNYGPIEFNGVSDLKQRLEAAGFRVSSGATVPNGRICAVIISKEPLSFDDINEPVQHLPTTDPKWRGKVWAFIEGHYPERDDVRRWGNIFIIGDPALIAEIESAAP